MRVNQAKGRAFFISMITLLVATSSTAATLTFGVYASDKPTGMLKKFKPIMDYLQNHEALAKQNITISMKIYPTYDGALDALVTGRCDFVRFGPASYILAKERDPEIKLLAMEHKKGQKRFNGVFIVTTSSPLSSLKDLKGTTFAFGNGNSTIGRYLAQAELAKAGVTAKDLKRYKYLGRHDKVALAVSTGSYDVGVVKENTFKKYAESKSLRKLGSFPNVTKPWIARSGLDAVTCGALTRALLSLTDKTVLKSLKQDGFLAATDADYDFVRKGMQEAKTFAGGTPGS